MMKILLLLVLIILTAGLQRPPSQKPQRLPLQKKKIVLKSPTNYAHRIIGQDPKTNEPVYYDPKPRVVLLDAKSGKYGLKWIGYDGKEKEIIYQRPDTINAVVSARISGTASGQYVYFYEIQNLPSSGQHLTTFAVQNFALDVKPAKIENVYIGAISRNDREFKDGDWISFGIFSTFKPDVTPGRSVEFKLNSYAPPGLVECRIRGGARGMRGVGEEPPQELENVLPGYEAWPSGYTIGPVEELKNYTATQLAQYIRERLPRFKQLGWISGSLIPLYEQNLTGDRIENLYRHSEQDLKSGNITTEMFAMVQAMKK